MILAIMQPTFNPWLGFFDLIDYVDEFVFLDNVQLTKRSWHVRNKLKINSKEYMFTFPIIKETSRDLQMLNESRIFNAEQSKEKLYNLIQQNYKKSKYFLEINDFIKDIIFYKTEYISQYNINIITKIAKKLGISTKFITLSEIDYQTDSSKGELILDICNYFNASKYISPLGSKNYLDQLENRFKSNKISIYYQYYKHPVYQQLGSEFIPYIGILDLLYNEGFQESIKIIRSGRNYENR